MKRYLLFLLLLLCLLVCQSCSDGIHEEEYTLSVRIYDTVYCEPQYVEVYLDVENDLNYGYAMNDVKVIFPDGTVEYVGTIPYREYWTPDEDFSIWVPQSVIDEGVLVFTCEYSMTNPSNGHRFERVDSVEIEIEKAKNPVHEWFIEAGNDIENALGNIILLVVLVVFFCAMFGGGADGILIIFGRK